MTWSERFKKSNADIDSVNSCPTCSSGGELLHMQTHAETCPNGIIKESIRGGRPECRDCGKVDDGTNTVVGYNGTCTDKMMCNPAAKQERLQQRKDLKPKKPEKPFLTNENGLTECHGCNKHFNPNDMFVRDFPKFEPYCGTCLFGGGWKTLPSYHNNTKPAKRPYQLRKK